MKSDQITIGDIYVLDGPRDYCKRVDVSSTSLRRAFEQHQDDTGNHMLSEAGEELAVDY
jgi:hypothetical protein